MHATPQGRGHLYQYRVQVTSYDFELLYDIFYNIFLQLALALLLLSAADSMRTLVLTNISCILYTLAFIVLVIQTVVKLTQYNNR